jgi:hypothetical protein
VAIIQRRDFDGVAREEALWWTLRRDATKGAALCRMLTHPLGHELRLEVSGQVVQSQVCRTDEDVLTCQERWRAVLEMKGWTRGTIS